MVRNCRWRRGNAAVLALLAATTGCATQKPPRSALEHYPPWLIAVAEPVAPAVGFVISRVDFRPGYLGAHEAALRRVAAEVRPLDILLFSSKGRLTGRTGSGLFGHSAVYFGDERQLRAAGLWNDPEVVAHQADIRAGRLYAESAQRTGTGLSTLHWVGNTDRIVILRPANHGAAWRRRTTRAVAARLGGKFDHRFDLAETEKLFCTELIDQAMPELALKRRVAYRREIILPDDVALQALAGRGLSIVDYLKADEKGWRAAGPATLAADIRAAAK